MVRTYYSPSWFETIVYNTRDVDSTGETDLVVGQGQKSGAFYLLALDESGHVVECDLAWGQ